MDWNLKSRISRTAVAVACIALASGVVTPAFAATSSSLEDSRLIWREGPYQGNPDDPGIDRPQMLHPERGQFVGAKQWVLLILPSTNTGGPTVMIVVRELAHSGNRPILIVEIAR